MNPPCGATRSWTTWNIPAPGGAGAAAEGKLSVRTNGPAGVSAWRTSTVKGPVGEIARMLTDSYPSTRKGFERNGVATVEFMNSSVNCLVGMMLLSSLSID